jgi:hypothetical protein
MLRHCCALLTVIGTIVLAPYFVHVGRCDAGGEFDVCPGAYMSSITYVIITCLLLNVQVRGWEGGRVPAGGRARGGGGGVLQRAG